MSNAIREIVCGYIENIRPKLENIVSSLYSNPEISGEEDFSSSLLIDTLKHEGFNISSPIGGIPYSFRADYGSSSPNIGYICEYDAIAGIGHGCGHNIVSAISCGAAIGLKRAVDQIGGSVSVIGCPSEESYPTKITLSHKKAFSNIDALICGHAWNKTCESGTSYGMKVIAFTFHGISAHTSINPQQGNNPLNPCVLTIRLCDIIKSKYSGKAFINCKISDSSCPINLIPEFYSCSFMVKSKETSNINEVIDRLTDCAKYASELYSCNLEAQLHFPEYLPLKTHEALSRVACHNLKERGIIEMCPPDTSQVSLDIGNVSHKIPTIHPYIGICEENVPYYSKEFASSTIKKPALDAMVKAACGLALTGIDIIQKPDILS